MRTFVLERTTDFSGVSGIGTIAEGVQFSDGRVAIRWKAGDHPSSTGAWDCIEDVERIHGHDGATKVVWASRTVTSEVHYVGAEGDQVVIHPLTVRAGGTTTTTTDPVEVTCLTCRRYLEGLDDA